jgi:hypothetical protein
MSEPASITTCRSCSRSLRLPQHGAEVFIDCSLEEFAAELSGRYGSFFSTSEYFAMYAHPPNYNACVLEAPRHAILFSVDGHTADLLNRLIDIEPEALERAAAAIFAALPHVHRILTEIKFPAAEVRRSHRVTQTSEDMVVDLPADADAYHDQIGNTTRKHLRQYGNKLRREYPGFELRRLERDEISMALVEQTVAWTNERVRAKGDVSVYEEDPRKVERLWRLLQPYGLALCGSIDDDLVAAQLILHVGRDTWIHTVGFDSRYERIHLGLLMTYYSILESIERGCRRTHMLFGTPVYKQRLGAKPVTARLVSLFRSPAYKALYAREVGEILVRDRQRIYWEARHRAGYALKAARRRTRTGAVSDDSSGRVSPADDADASGS